MTDNLRATLVSAIQPIVPIRLSEAETNDYPFAVYDMTSEQLRDKDGVYGYSGATRISVVSESFDEADAIRASIEAAVDSAFVRPDYFSRLQSVEKDCIQGVWIIELNYILKQYKTY